MSKYCLLYHPGIPVHYVNPVLPLTQLLDDVNMVLTKARNDHNPAEQNNLARMVRINWMVEDLKYNKIVKPIVLNLRYFTLTTITGDTRLQAISLSPHIKTVSALLTVKEEYVDQFSDWELISDVEDLCWRMGGLPPEKILLSEGVDNWYDQELDWIEFDLQETSNHMHDEDQRLRMIYNYLDQQTEDFQFTKEWLQTPIEWNQYDF